jgi:hypothetical protein
MTRLCWLDNTDSEQRLNTIIEATVVPLDAQALHLKMLSNFFGQCL